MLCLGDGTFWVTGPTTKPAQVLAFLRHFPNQEGKAGGGVFFPLPLICKIETLQLQNGL